MRSDLMLLVLQVQQRDTVIAVCYIVLQLVGTFYFIILCNI